MSTMNLGRIGGYLSDAGIKFTPNGKTIISGCPLCKGAGTMTSRVEFGQMRNVCTAGCDETAIILALAADKDPSRPRFDAYKVEWDESGKTPKLVLPGVPHHDDLRGQLAWITVVLNLDREHPVTHVAHYGRRGQEGDVELTRLDAPPIRFEPAAAMYSARRLIPMVGCLMIPTDAEMFGFKDDHCRRIAHVVNLASEVCTAPSAAQEAGLVVGTFTARAAVLEGFTTYGDEQERYRAQVALAQQNTDKHGPSWARCLLDENTGEYVIRVSDLQAAAREAMGCSLPHGWLDSRMASYGWERATIHGRAQPGRAGRAGPHMRCDFYRGHMDAPQESGNAPGDHVNT